MAVADLPPANLVLLVDVSGSMQAMRVLASQLRREDHVAIAV